MISEQDFIQAMSYIEGRTVPLSLALLELMFGPGEREGDSEVLRARKSFVKKLPGEVVFWPDSEERQFNVLHVGLFKQADVLRISSERTPLEDDRPDPTQNMISDIMNGFRKSRKCPIQKDTIVVLSVQDEDKDERTIYFSTYFWANPEDGGIASFTMKEPIVDDAAAREYLRDFYTEHLSMLYGKDWRSAFFLSDLQANLMWELPADWKMTPDGVTADLSPDISVKFCKDFNVRLGFGDRVFWHQFSLYTRDYADAVSNTVKQLLDRLIPTPHCYPLMFKSNKIPMSAQQIVEIVSTLPPWMRKIFESNIQECHTHDDAMIKHLEQDLKSIQDRRDLTKQALDLLQEHDVTLKMIESGDAGFTV